MSCTAMQDLRRFLHTAMRVAARPSGQIADILKCVSAAGTPPAAALTSSHTQDVALMDGHGHTGQGWYSGWHQRAVHWRIPHPTQPRCSSSSSPAMSHQRHSFCHAAALGMRITIRLRVWVLIEREQSKAIPPAKRLRRGMLLLSCYILPVMQHVCLQI